MIAGGASSALSACYADGTSVPAEKASAAKEGVGSLGVNLTVGRGVILTTATYAITGSGSYMKMGSIDLTSAASLSAVIGGIPAGTGYSIAISSTAADGLTTCGGSNGFAVTAHTTTNTTVALDCHQPKLYGSVHLNGVTNICPVINSITMPMYANVGDTVAVSAFVHDTDQGPSPLTYQWSTTGGMLDAMGPSGTFTCTEAGIVTISLTVSDGDPKPACAATKSTLIGCLLPDGGL
jgi:hypothetical protein